MTDHPLRTLACRVVGLADATHDTRIVSLEAVDGTRFGFAAGQYAVVGFAGLPGRDYSMANRPGATPIEFHIRRMAGAGASVHATRDLALGDAVTIEGPYGDGWLRTDHGGPILAVAGGSGLAPMKAIVETALAVGMGQDIHLYFGVREERDVYLAGHFEDLAAACANFRFIAVLSDESGATARRRGPLDAAVLADFSDFAGFKAYLAGPPAMVDATVEALAAHGLPRADIHADPFVTDAEKRARQRARDAS